MNGLTENMNPKEKEIHRDIIKVLEKNNLYVEEAIRVLHETEIILGKITRVKLD